MQYVFLYRVPPTQYVEYTTARVWEKLIELEKLIY